MDSSMRSRMVCMLRLALTLLLTGGLSHVCYGGGGGKDESGYYKEPQVYNLRPNPDREKHFGHIGVTGIVARIYKGVLVKVETVDPNTPATGKFKKGQIIAGLNGETLKGRNPFVVLGNALNKAESSNGRLTFDVQEKKGGPVKKVMISVPVLGKYSKTWPLNCTKSKKIAARAAKYYSTDPEFKKQYLDSKGIGGALACLFLMSTGEDKYMPVVKAYFDKFPKSDPSSIGDHTWNNGYNGIACAEYYLRSGDKSVLPILQYYCDNARDRQQFDCGWNHWSYGVNPGYVGGGLMNPAGSQIVTSLLLAKECGVKVDAKTLLNALRQWYRFAGHGTVPYGDHRPEGGLGSNGKDGMAAAMMQAASCAQGDTTIYKMARDLFSMSTVTSYPVMVVGHADEGRGDAMWRGLASSFMIKKKPELYRDTMDRITWWYTLSRRPNGSFGVVSINRTQFDDPGTGAGVAMTYTAHLKKLRICGAPRSPYAKNFTLPANIWGRKADRAFLSIDHNPKYLAMGKPEPIYVPLRKLGSAYSKGVDPKSIPKEYLVRNCYHARYMIRCQAAKALRAAGAFGELEKLLNDPDPRVRRAGLDGMTDYKYWFSIGRNPIKPEQVTPGMVAALKRMLTDPNEALWVVDGALMAMKFAPAKDINKCLPQILPWTKHETWYLRESSFYALTGLQKDDALLNKVLPLMNDMMVAEYHTQPRQRMTRELQNIMKKRRTTEMGKTILATFKRAIKESEIKPNVGKKRRATEGAYNVVASANVCLKEAPETALTVAKMIQDRFKDLETKQIIQLAGTPNSSREGAPFGFYTLLNKLPSARRKELEDMLCNVYLPELKRRMKVEGENMSLLNSILDLAKIKNPNAGWHAIGSPKPSERIWRFISFDPFTEKDQKHEREKKRFRNVTLPRGLKSWYTPEFNDSKWNKGKAPIGIGEHKRGRTMFKNNSYWGKGEFLLARTSFELDAVDCDSYRISILCRQGFNLYVNGKKVATYVWWKDKPFYRLLNLSGKTLHKGRNVLAFYGNVEYLKGVKSNPVGQIDFYIEGLKKSDLR